MWEQVFSPQLVGLLCGVFSIIAGISLCAYLLERKTRKGGRRKPKLGLKLK